MISAGHRLTAEAAEHMLRAGGNAYDAVIAAAAAACVVEPALASLGGGGFLLSRPSQGISRVCDFFVQTPRVCRPQDEQDFYPVVLNFGSATQTFHIGRGASAVPGVVKGLFDVHEEFATIPMPELMEPAMEYASRGATITGFSAYTVRLLEGIFTATPAITTMFASPTREGKLVREGETLRMPDLADAMDALSREGAGLFYRGEIGQRLVNDMGNGGHITAEDLQSYQTERREPLNLEYRGLDVMTNPPPSSGGLLLAFALKLLDSVRMPAFGSPEHVRLLTDIFDLTSQARIDAGITDSVSDADAERVLDPEYLALWTTEVLTRARANGGTTHINVIDKDFNVASVSISNGEGSAYVIPGTGISVNNMLGEQDLNRGGFHCWPSGERMTSMMAPTVVMKPDGGVVSIGSGGSNRIRSAMLQVLINLLDHGMSVENAVYSPRIHYEEGLLSVEGDFDHEKIASVLKAFPDHQWFSEPNMFFGGAHTATAASDGFGGAGDPRRGGHCTIVG